LATLSGGKREKKVLKSKIKSIEKKTTQPVEQKTENKTKSVGWEYRYRVSKMLETQKRDKSKGSASKQQQSIPAQKKLAPELSQLTPEDRTAGWKYRLVEYVHFFKKTQFFHSLF